MENGTYDICIKNKPICRFVVENNIYYCCNKEFNNINDLMNSIFQVDRFFFKLDLNIIKIF